MDAGPFQGRLLSGERILWGGRPAGGFLFTGRDVLLIPFSLVWAGFAVFWTFGATHAPTTPMFVRLWGLMFVTAGLYFVVGRFLVDMWLRARTFYAVTDQRVLILRKGWFPKFTAIQLSHLPQLELVGTKGDYGTLCFGPQTLILASRMGWSLSWTPALDPTPQFLRIPEAAKVMDLILRTARPAS